MSDTQDIKKIIDEACFKLGIKGKELAKELGISPSYLSDIKNGNKPAASIIGKISLLLESKSSEFNSPNSPAVAEEVIGEEVPTAIPIIPPTIIDNPAISIRKDMQENISDYETFDFEEIIKYIESGIRVRTEKLAPYINVGDIIFIKRLDNGHDIINGSPCLVDTSNLGGLIRYVFDEGDELRLIATNRALDIIVPKVKVRSVWPIVGRYTPGISMPDYLTNKQIEQQGKNITSLVDSVNHLVSATIDEGKRTDRVLDLLEKEIERNAKK